MFLAGDKVQITPRGEKWAEFFAYIDGWNGTVEGLNNGTFAVRCMREDGPKTFFVPPECLTKITT